MVILQETIPTKTEVEERIATAESTVVLGGLKKSVEAVNRRRPIPTTLMALDGRSYESLTPVNWREIANYQQPEIYLPDVLVMPGSEEALEALGEKF